MPCTKKARGRRTELIVTVSTAPTQPQAPAPAIVPQLPLTLAAAAAAAATTAATAAAEQKLLEEAAAMSPALTGPEPTQETDTEYEELIDIDRVEGRVKASSVKKVGEIVEKHPEEALSIIRSWMYQEA